MKKVVKFGGSSLASAEQFKKVGILSGRIRPEDMWFPPRPVNVFQTIQR